MPTRHVLFAAAVAVALTAIGETARAQESDNPWDPKKFSQSELIDFGTFERSPLVVPWESKRVEQVGTRGGVDFKHVLDANVQEVHSYFVERYRNDESVVKLKPFATPKGASPELGLIGRSSSGSTYQFVVGNEDLRRKFRLVLERKQGETILTFRNVSYSMVFSAGVPARAPFTPVDADPVPLQF